MQDEKTCCHHEGRPRPDAAVAARGHVANRDSAERIGPDRPATSEGDHDVEAAAVPIRGVHEAAGVDPVAHELEVEAGHGWVDGKVETGGPGEADGPDCGGGQGGAPGPQPLEYRVQADGRQEVRRRDQATPPEHVGGAIR